MSLKLILLMIFTVLLLSSGQILFKLVALNLKSINLHSLFQLKLILALTLYGVATAFWIAVLRQVPLRIAYPYMSLTFLVVPVLSWLFLGEQISFRAVLGSTIIVVGVLVAVS